MYDAVGLKKCWKFLFNSASGKGVCNIDGRLWTEKEKGFYFKEFTEDIIMGLSQNNLDYAWVHFVQILWFLLQVKESVILSQNLIHMLREDVACYPAMSMDWWLHCTVVYHWAWRRDVYACRFLSSFILTIQNPAFILLLSSPHSLWQVIDPNKQKLFYF